ncbi:DUF429 domain-containing protein [Rhodococcus ruber]|uniref:DUF429 domain-containing protein n=1 Tax=Rhodococcus TaxID=1827 RepID=UPI00200EF224|nr:MULTISPECIES: DUF429 domain-containing protein [Rhodococcus]UQB74449.1 DUF429 domain-containing protein [Rhodococcus ruber]WML64499.1 DUF429 domain-containing protein [Rhodococcus sp. AH-ZY2]
MHGAQYGCKLRGRAADTVTFVKTVGVDLAAEPAKTAVATLAWEHGTATVQALRLGATDPEIVAAIVAADRSGIDAPFGWPDAFVEFLGAHHRLEYSRERALSSRPGRLPLVRRSTDRVVHARTGIVPLSVSADLIAHVALRCAGLLAELDAVGVEVDRVDGAVVEAYPAAALQGWGLPFKGYKSAKNREVRAASVAVLEGALPGLTLGGFRDLCVDSDDAFDAVVAGLVARAAALGRTVRPDAAQHPVAVREGWIHLPVCGIGELL